MIKERIPISGDLGSKVKQLMEYAGWQEGRKVDISIAEQYYACLLYTSGVKREQAILELGKDEANGELLFQLVNTEKGKCKTAAQKALAQLCGFPFGILCMEELG